MALVPIPADEWTEVVTTVGNTIVQNMDSHFPVYITTADPTGLDLNNGILLPSLAAITFPETVTVQAASIHRPSVVSYMAI